MKNILICLEKMGIGGVETSVINQAIEYKRKGINCIIASGDGVLGSVLQENGIKHEIIDFPLEQNIDIIKTKKMIEIIEKYDIEQVIINQLPCLLSVLPACIIKNIPYVAYVHTPKNAIRDDEKNIYDWYESKYPIFKELLSFFYKNARKVISISKVAQDYVKNRYELDENKMIVIHNSINLEKYKSTKEVLEKNKFVLISRISTEKLQSIKNGIDIFDEYDNKDKKLTIVGDGDKFEEVKKYASSKECSDKIVFIGKQSDVIDLINENDVVLGLDRVLLEAIAMKRVAVNIGYSEPKQIIDISNISTEADEGFCGDALKSSTIKELAGKIKECNVNLQENYNYVKNNLNIENNIYIEDVEKNNYENAILDVFNILMDKQEEISNLKNKLENRFKNKKNKILSLQKELDNKTTELNNIQEEYSKVFEELKSVYNSKRFKLVNKIANIYNRKNKKNSNC